MFQVRSHHNQPTQGAEEKDHSQPEWICMDLFILGSDARSFVIGAWHVKCLYDHGFEDALESAETLTFASRTSKIVQKLAFFPHHLE